MKKASRGHEGSNLGGIRVSQECKHLSSISDDRFHGRLVFKCCGILGHVWTGQARKHVKKWEGQSLHKLEARLSRKFCPTFHGIALSEH
eukprot:CAMPEP_0182940592 /NCGR_PEP_ID=MMETSP0105_2-20130417/47549_1 /TAXON_ID=81532 ORGANISM="Acanthoeca-like sp., Strain 10tr" /NCGR_SAMPLE_ID=MMETSP0105_2 /ASSEMBLY_ACC=CAM_ASM_000205 /LENGTH=88 /DNA_ID=CAMNT_0025080097 /DNA_START=33 /DNA_END=300 /DNA_ORIENTATION=+